jgi:hypothetical protein
VNPRMEFSGVRSSCLVLDRNGFFARVARIAASLAAVGSVARLASSASVLRSKCADAPGAHMVLIFLEQQQVRRGEAHQDDHRYRDHGQALSRDLIGPRLSPNVFFSSLYVTEIEGSGAVAGWRRTCGRGKHHRPFGIMLWVR